MNSSNGFNSKRYITNILSLGVMLLGIACICWALVHIHEQTVNTADIVDVSINPFLNFKNVEISEVFPPFNPFKIYTPLNPTETFIPIKHDQILYPVRPAMGDNIGSLFIPALKQTLPIIHGADEDELKKGVGHFAQSVLPGENNNSVLSGHRDTVFRELGKLKIDDQLITKTSAGTFTYVINNTRIVHKDDKTVIVPTDHAVLTVTTCYPFRYIGDAPDRYIITADLVKSEKLLG
jgi:sortase A